MATISVVLFMLGAVVVSGILVRVMPRAIPTPLVQIAFGAAIAAGSEHEVQLDPEIFFLLFLPPLLFLDGWRIPKEGLLRDKGFILELALGLVFCTVLGMGLFIHWMIPAMPYPVAFALAAIGKRLFSLGAAARASWEALKSMGWGMLLEFICAALATTAFVVGAFIHFT